MPGRHSGTPEFNARAQQAGESLPTPLDGEWVVFDPMKGSGQELPPERRYVLCQMPSRIDAGRPCSVVVGYLRYASGDKESPQFITPGIGGIPTHWRDCLGDGFSSPGFKP